MLYRYVTREDEVDVAMVQGMNMGNMGRVIGFPWVTRFKMVSASCDEQAMLRAFMRRLKL